MINPSNKYRCQYCNEGFRLKSTLLLHSKQCKLQHDEELDSNTKEEPKNDII